MKFDPDKFHSRVYGDPVIKYEQDGKFYDQMGTRVQRPEEKDTTLHLPKKKGA
jgi:hypothetical protein